MGEIGINITIGNLSYATINTPPKLDDEPDTNNPTQQKVQNPTTKQSNHTQTDKRYKERTIAGGSKMTAPVAKGMLALDAINTVLQYAPGFFAKYEEYKIEKHHQILDKAINDVNVGISQGLVPKKYLNDKDLSSILNVVLQGESKSTNKELYNVGMNIYNTISKPNQDKEK
ncbi:MAG: hypothetical protein LBR81_08895 [Prevotellaceae bacterium]|nr:hypothetical protein [Prevotellaceae bacterium]